MSAEWEVAQWCSLRWSRAESPSHSTVSPAVTSRIPPKLTKGGKLAAVAFMIRMMLAPVPELDQWERERGYPVTCLKFLNQSL